MTTPKTLLVRADACVAMGTGHLMRMIALGQEWRRSAGDVVFLCAEVTPTLAERIPQEGFRIERLPVRAGTRDDLRATVAAATRRSPSGQPALVALDGYQFDAEFQRGIKRAGCRLLVVDDHGHADFYHADVVLNQNISASPELYARRDAGTQLLLGPKHALLRREFLGLRDWQREIPATATRLLVTLGGTDPNNVTQHVIHALVGSGFEVKAVVGGGNPHLANLRLVANTATDDHTRVDVVMNPTDMPALMRWADMAVSAAGSTSWELALAGLPSLFLIIAANQSANAYALERDGFGLCLGEHDTLAPRRIRDTVDRVAGDAFLRRGFSVRGRALVDGLGCARVLNTLSSSVPAT